ncbi:MAG: VOC family protein [Chloroflexi bacterium]|nr:VOC family protein [Chloroflexota bacterium]
MSQNTTQRAAPAHGAYTDDGTPRNATSLTPFMVVRDAARAIEFYQFVFGARLVDRTDMPGPNGTQLVGHAVLDMGHGLLQLGDAMPAYHLVLPPEGDDVCFSLGYYCPDVDAVVEKAVAAGALVREPATTFVSGDRFASIRDPFGIRWTIMTRVEDISPEESGRRVAEYFASVSPSR